MHIFGGDNIYMLNYKLCIENRLFNPLRSSSLVNLTITKKLHFCLYPFGLYFYSNEKKKKNSNY